MEATLEIRAKEKQEEAERQSPYKEMSWKERAQYNRKLRYGA